MQPAFTKNDRNQARGGSLGFPDNAAQAPAADRVSSAERNSRRHYPCSAGQQRLWVLDQLEPLSPSLRLAVRWRLEGALSVPDLEKSLQLIIARHGILRTSFTEIEGEPVQIVEPHVPFRIRLVELAPLLELRAGIEAERIAQLEARAPFHLRSGPPFIRATCLHLAEDSFVLLLTAHRMVCDGWSIGILAREMGEIYDALQSGRLPDLPALPPGYADFGEWQSTAIGSTSRGSDKAFWNDTLRGATHFDFPPDKITPPVLASNRNFQSLLLDRSLIDGLADLGGRFGCTMYMTTLAAFLVLLHRYTGETDICIGTPVAGRNRIELEHVIGLFTNMLVLRGDLSEDPSFAELLIRVRDRVTDALAHPDMPPGKLVEMLRPDRDRSRTPLLSVTYTVRRSFVEDGVYGGVRSTGMPSVPAGGMYDLNLSVLQRRDGWHLSCEYDSGLYQPNTIAQLLKHFRFLLHGATIDEDCRISALPMLDDAERRTALFDWNHTDTLYPRHLTVSQLLEAQAARTPDAIAVACGDRTMTFSELDLAANQLALRLRRQGLERGRCVGILLNRSMELVVALVSVLKAGLAYVPLDPAHPAERLSHILKDAGLGALITDRIPESALPLEGVPVIQLEGGATSAAPEEVDAPGAPSTPDDLAYVIYTSGSTGLPKGVEITHRSVVNLLYAMAARPGLEQHDVLLAVTTISFDIAALELFLPLVVGARLVLATEADVVDGARLLQLIEQRRVTVMQGTPASWRLLLEAGFRSRPGFKMMIGGESLPRELANRLLEGAGELWNMYGPTETTIWSSCGKMLSGDETITVGRPIANTRFYILDGKGEPVPAGVPGLLYIGGDGVARCYHNKPQLTAEKFTSNRFAAGRIYLTGDLARWCSNGDVQILGRIDHQIKLRGFRIEPAEIEAVLIRQPEVSEAVVILAEGANGEAALSAYVVPRRDHAQHAEALIRSLRSSMAGVLPAFMCPAFITLLDAMPKTPSGKTDRRALPAAVSTASHKKPEFAPFSAVEKRVAALWNAVLGLAVVDKHANFFEMGGHSLLAIRLLARIDAEFGQHFSLATLFQVPTLAEQAGLLEGSDTRKYDFRQVVRLQASGAKQPLIAINNTGIYYTLSKRLGPDRPFTTLQLFDPALSAESLPSSFEEIATRYVQLIRRVQTDGPYALLGWCVAGALAYEIAQQLCASGQEVSQLMLVDTYAPGYLTRLSLPRRLLSDYSYRWKLIVLDWSRVHSRQQSLGAFIGNRMIVKRLLKLFTRNSVIAEPTRLIQGKVSSPEVYDQWLLNYLDEAARRYQPKQYPGRILLFRSADEPSGRFLDAEMGWGEYAVGGLELTVVGGDHFIMFQDPGVSQMAATISAALDHGADTPMPRAGR